MVRDDGWHPKHPHDGLPALVLVLPFRRHHSLLGPDLFHLKVVLGGCCLAMMGKYLIAGCGLAHHLGRVGHGIVHARNHVLVALHVLLQLASEWGVLARK